MKINKHKKFILEFFKDSKVIDKNEVLTISEVPVLFEEFVGKKAPYKIVFDIDMHNKIADSELIMQGSYFLVAIKDYLSDKGQTSLLKINIKPELAELKKIVPKGSKFVEEKISTFGFLSEFYFMSVYQYLNEKKQIINNLLIKEDKILDLDINNFKFLKGNKEEVNVGDLDLAYVVAKNRLDELLEDELIKIKKELKEKLEKGLFRVKSHYSKQIREKDEELETCERKIKLLEGKLAHTFYDRDIFIIKRQIRESNERLEMLRKKGYRERLKAEEAFHINDEVEKHVLSIRNNLINLTLYYYPIYDISVKTGGKIKTIKYDPFLKKVLK